MSRCSSSSKRLLRARPVPGIPSEDKTLEVKQPEVKENPEDDEIMELDEEEGHQKPNSEADKNGEQKKPNRRKKLGWSNSKKKPRQKQSSSWMATNSSGVPFDSSPYTYSCHAVEDHKSPIFSCKFNHCLKDGQPLIFATVGSNRVTIYEATKDGEIKILQCYLDPSPKEEYFTCAWSLDAQNKSILAAGGQNGLIRFFSPTTGSCPKFYRGHGSSINELVFFPNNRHLLVSASKDHSVRIWNAQSNVLVAMLAGYKGHRDEVLSVDVDASGSRIVSCGMDHSLMIWCLKPEIQEAIDLSFDFDHSKFSFPTYHQQYPQYTTRDIHRNYIDCVRWFGDVIFSKSTENRIVCWKPGELSTTLKASPPLVVTNLGGITDCESWYIRFSIALSGEKVALGNTVGKVHLYEFRAKQPFEIKPIVLSHPKCTKLVRETAFSRDGSVLIYVCDDGSIWRWNANKEWKGVSIPDDEDEAEIDEEEEKLQIE